MSSQPNNGRRTPDARLLVVEDEPNILELLSASLRYSGFEVVTAAAGGEAVQAAQRHRPDLIVLDVMLPDMDGFDVIRRLVVAPGSRSCSLPRATRPRTRSAA